MTSIRLCVLVSVFCVIVAPCFAGVTIEQMKQSTEMVRKVCQPKNKVSDELVDGINSGKFPDEKPLKCYIYCVLEMMTMMKKSKINYDATIKQIDLLMPDELKEPNKNSLTICKDSTNGIKDVCEAAYTLLQCLYKNNPKFMFT